MTPPAPAYNLQEAANMHIKAKVAKRRRLRQLQRARGVAEPFEDLRGILRQQRRHAIEDVAVVGVQPSNLLRSQQRPSRSSTKEGRKEINSDSENAGAVHSQKRVRCVSIIKRTVQSAN